jgi:hypothetical protein
MIRVGGLFFNQEMPPFIPSHPGGAAFAATMPIAGSAAAKSSELSAASSGPLEIINRDMPPRSALCWAEKKLAPSRAQHKRNMTVFFDECLQNFPASTIRVSD